MVAVIVSCSILERTDVERSLLNEGQNHNYEKKRNTGNEQVQKYGQKRHESQITIVISGYQTFCPNFSKGGHIAPPLRLQNQI